jgi:DNA-nicking Smr family endonuclease
MPDLEPLPKGKKGPKGKKKVAPRPAPARRAGHSDSPVAFHFPEADEPLLGVAAGIQASQLRDLRRGRIRPEEKIDLHGLRVDEARRQLLCELRRAAENGKRCLVVIHGKGLRSPGRPVLRTALPGWLADPELAGCVLAFAPACVDDGGSGATYVLLRRTRSR